MTSVKPGERVFAVLAANDHEVQFLGVGMYVGDETPPAPTGFHRAITGATTWEEWEQAFASDGIPIPPRPTNPKLQLDDGAVVWGMECWWGAESAYAKFRGALREVKIDITKARSR